MKYVKMLGLAAVAAAALMAFVGASSASATVLCKTPGTGTPTGTTCPSGWAYTGGQEIHAVSVGTTKLTTSFKNIECSESTAKGTLDGTSSEDTAGGAIATLTFGGCNCTVNVIAPGRLDVDWIEGTHNGTVTSSGAEVTASCSTIFGNVHCIYSTGAGTSVGDLIGGTDPIMELKENNIPRLSTSVACAAEAHWDGSYTVTTPQPLYVTGHT